MYADAPPARLLRPPVSPCTARSKARWAHWPGSRCPLCNGRNGTSGCRRRTLRSPGGRRLSRSPAAGRGRRYPAGRGEAGPDGGGGGRGCRRSRLSGRAQGARARAQVGCRWGRARPGRRGAASGGVCENGNISLRRRVRGRADGVGARVGGGDRRLPAGPPFGPLVLVGLGGLYAEVLRDVAVALAPANRSRARGARPLSERSCAATGARGRPALDVAGLARAAAALSSLAASHPEIVEIEINPLLVTPDGVVGLDARVVLDDL